MQQYEDVDNNGVFNDMRDSINRSNFRQKAEDVGAKLDSLRHGPVKEIWNIVTALWARVTDPNRSFLEKAIPLAALVYLVTPVDLIPDILPVIGYLDDIAVCVWAAKSALGK